MTEEETDRKIDGLKIEHVPVAGAGILALGVAIGFAIAPDAPSTPDPVVELGSAVGSAPARAPDVDVAGYHSAVSKARRGHNVVDVLEPSVAPGAIVTTTVNMDAGTRPTGRVDLFGGAVGRFSTECEGCGVSYADRPDGTVIVLRAQNTSQDAAPLMALVHYTPKR